MGQIVIKIILAFKIYTHEFYLVCCLLLFYHCENKVDVIIACGN